MERSKYFNTRRGQANLYSKRKRRDFNFSFDAGTLKTKNSVNKEENLRFQRELIAEMVRFKRRMFRGNVVLEMNFTIAQDNAPEIQSLPKYYIDLLENVQSELKSDCKKLLKNGNKLLLNNDRQVKLLIVNYYVQNHIFEAKDVAEAKDPSKRPERIKESSIRISISSFSNFHDDMALFDRVRHNSFEDEDDRYSYRRSEFRFEDPDGIDYNEEARHDEALDDFRDLLQNKETHLAYYSEKQYEEQLLWSKKMAQEYFLRQRKIKLFNWINMFSETLNKKKDPYLQELLKNMNDSLRGFLFSSYFSIELPGTPRQGGDAKSFREKTEEAFKEYYKKNTLLNPLHHPISTTILLVPPSSGGKDLDNLALAIIPIIHKVLNPPSFEKVYNSSPITSKDLIEGVRKRKFNGIPKTMVTSYTVVELPRSSSDSENGSVRVLFEDGDRLYEDVWRRIQKVLDEWEEYVNDNY